MTKPQNPHPRLTPMRLPVSGQGSMEATYASGEVHLDGRYSPSRLPYGRVVDVVGDAWVKDPVTLILRRLVAGDFIERASVVLTDQNGIIQIEPQHAPRATVVPAHADPAPRAPAEPVPAQKVVPGSLSEAYRVDRVHESVHGSRYDLDPVMVAHRDAEANRHAGGVGVAVSSVTVNEGAGTATFTIRLDHMADGVVRVGYSTHDGTATTGADFGSAFGVLVFQPGEVSKTISVPIFNDAVYEGAEDFRIVLSPAPGAWESPLSTGIGTIMDDGTGSVPAGVTPDNDTPVVSIIGVVVNEASPFAEFRVTLSNPAKMPVTVNYGSADGTAQAGADYTAVTGVITFAPGELEQVIRVPILNDGVYEGSESFSVYLGDPVNALIGVPQTTATIVDDGTGLVPPGIAPDDDRPRATINDVVVNEAAGAATFTVTLAGTATTPITIDYAIADGTAKAGHDYAATTGTLTFAPGELTRTITVPILDDAVYEGSETFTVNLTHPSANALIADPVGLGTIKDDGTGSLLPGVTPDDDRPVVSINDVLVNEASAKATFTVTLSNPSDLPVTIKYSSVNGTAEAGLDYDAVLGVLTFAPGELTKTIDVLLHNDAVYEGAETFQIVLADPTNAKVSAAGAGVDAMKDGTGIGTIVDDGTGLVPPGVTPDNDIPVASINDVVVNEAAGTASFTVTLSNAAKMPVTLDYASADGTAKAALDYVAVAGTLTFAPGELTRTITVPILDDAVYESSETFAINLSVPSHATITGGVGLGTIKDDGTGTGGIDNDTPHLVWRRMDDVNEGAGRAVFVLELSNPSDLPVSVDYVTRDGAALAGADYVGASGVLTFAPGEVSKIVSIDLVNDRVYEGREDFGLALSSPVNAVIDRPDVTVGIVDDGGGAGPSPLPPGWTPDDDRPQISVGDVVVNEGAVMAEFRITLSNPAAMPVTVHYATQDGTALAGADYVSTAGTLVVPAGVTEMVVRVPILNDTIYEGQESFRLVLSDPTNAVLAQPIGTGIIRDDGLGAPPPIDLTPIGWIPDNDAPRVSVSTTNVWEDAGYSVFSVRLDHPSTESIRIALALKDIEATQSVDYGSALSYSLDHGLTWVPGNVLPFASGVTEVMVRTSIVNDGVSEFDERFTVQADVISGTTVNTSAAGDVAIIDVTPAPQISVADVTVSESDPAANFVVTLSAPSVHSVTVSYTTTDGTAASGSDYAGQSGTITFAPGEVSKTVSIPIVDDLVPELGERFALLLSSPVGAVLSNATAAAVIVDNDSPVVNVTVLDAVVNEGGGTVSFVIAIDRPSPVDVFVDYATVSGTASDGVDYWNRAGFVVVPAGTTSVTVSIPILNDEVYEGLENFGFVISNPRNATLGVGFATGGIIDDGTGSVPPGWGPDDDTPIVSVTSGRFGESAGYAIFQIGLNNPSAKPVVIDLALSGGVDLFMPSAIGGGVDYGPMLEVSVDGVNWLASNSVTFAVGVVSALVRTPIIDDLAVEPLESFVLTATPSPLSPTPMRLPGATGEAIILDNDVIPVALAISDVVANEGGVATFTVTLSTASTTPVSVDYATADGGAMAGADYTATSGTLTFAPGETTKTITVGLINDVVYEGAETFFVNLGTPVNAVISDPLGLGTIMDDGTGIGGSDDDRSALAVNSLVVNEAIGTAYFTVTMTGASTTPVTVNYATADGSALAGSDYTAVSGTLTFAPGETSKTIAVPILNDVVAEYSEAFDVVLTSAVGGVISVAHGSGEIRDDGTGTGGTDNDFPVGPSVLVSEADGFAVITVVRTSPWSSTNSITINPVDQTAVAGVDFVGTPGVINFAAGEVTRTFILPLIPDASPEAVKHLTYSVFNNATGVQLSPTYERTIFITDSPGPFDTTPKLFIESSHMAEPDAASGHASAGYMVFRAAMLSSGGGALSGPVTYNLSLGGGAATGGGVDYGSAGADNLQVSTDGGSTWSNATSVTFPAGYQATPNVYDVLIRTAVVDDAFFERQESFNLTATLSSGVAASSEVIAQGVIFDSDPVSLAPSGWIIGSDLGLSDQVLTGTAGGDVIMGIGPAYACPSDKDTIDGGASNDTIVGGVGNDILTGGLGNDVFEWNSSDYLVARFLANPTERQSVDVITDFSLVVGEDALDLRGLLVGEHATAVSLDKFLSFASDGAGGTMISLSPEAGPLPEMKIQLQGVDLYAAFGFAAGAPDAYIISELLARNKLVVDA